MAEENEDAPDLGIDFSEYPNTKSGWAQRWGAEFAYAKEFHRKWQATGKQVVGKFLMRDVQTNDPQAPGFNLNLFGANVTTMLSMLYGRVPQVSVDRRWADPGDQVARVASEMATRILNADIEEAGEDFSTVLRNCLQDRLVPGLGCARIRYGLDESEKDPDENKLETGKEDYSGKIDEWLEDIYVPWADVIWSPARFWKEIRWIAFRTYKSKKDLEEFLGDKADLRGIPFNSKNPMEQLSAKTSQVWNKAEVWEIWSKEFGRVQWYIEGFNEILKDIPDPLGLDGFFPCPPFFIANVTTMEYCPKADYTFAESLYKEIDLLEERISLLTKAIKVVGVYDKKAGPDIGRMVNETAENKLIPVDSWAVFQERGGIKGSVEFLPIEQIVGAVKELQAQQADRINQLYQITGMSDILRGAADDKQQVGTQQLKAKFASIRVQAIQDEFTRFATDLQKIRLELISKHFDVETIIAKSNMTMTPDGQNAQLLMQAAQFIKDTEISKWRLLIAPESMAMTDYSQLRMERTEYINSLGIFLQSSYPIAEKFPGAAPILMELLKWGLAGFKGSKQIEGVIDQAMGQMQQMAAQQAQQPKPPDPQQVKAQADIAKVKLEMQGQQQDHQQKMTEMQQKHQMEMQKMQADFIGQMREIMLKQHDREHSLKTKVLEQAMVNGPQVQEQPVGPLSLGPEQMQPPAQGVGGVSTP